MIAPTTLTQAGPQQVLRGNNDFWNYNNEGYPVRYHRNKRKALFVPGNNCPVSLDALDNYRRTIIRRPNGNNEDFVEQYHDLDKNKQKRLLQGDAWTGETWLKVTRQSAATQPPAAQLRTQVPQQQQPQQSPQAAHHTSQWRNKCQHKQTHTSKQSTENHFFDILQRCHHQQPQQYQTLQQ